MWTKSEFITKYLQPKKLADKWNSLIYPSMKDAIICSMLVAQDTIEPRRVRFLLILKISIRSLIRIHLNYSVLILCLEKILNLGLLK
jgi:hypothetical protein